MEYREISSKDNDKIKLYKKLSEDKKYRRREGLFTMEGIRLVTDAANEAVELHCVFVSESCAEKYGEALKSLESCTKALYLIPDSLALHLAETKGTQGLFAIGKIPNGTEPLDKSACSDKIKKGGRYLILDCIQDPGNMGTMLRTADACGIDGVFVCGCCDIYSPKVIRSAMGSIFRIKASEADYYGLVEAMREKGVTVYAAVIDSDARNLLECDFSQGGAAVIGNEGNGISPEHTNAADVPMTIRMHGTINSLNAAMAAGIIMWELSK